MTKAIKLSTALVVLALLIAACGDGDDEVTPDTLPETTEATPDTLPETTEAATEPTATPDTLPEVEGVGCDEPVTVGVITDLTGALAIYGAHINRSVPIGFAYATGGEVQTGMEQMYMLGDCEIRVVFKDDQSNPELSAAVARELIDDEGADVIIGSVNPGATATLQEIAGESNVILIVAPAAATDLTGKTFNPNTFRASRSNYQDGLAICDQFVNNDGFKSFVQIAPDYAFGHDGAGAYEDACTYFGGEFLSETVFAPADTDDFAPFMTPLADSGADAFLVTWEGGRFPRLLESAIAESVINDTTVLGAPFVDNAVMPAFFADAIGTTSVISYHYAAPSNPVNDYLVEQVAAHHETFPDLYDADGMNAAIMVVEALKAVGGAADADSLKAGLEGLSFEGPKGLIEIRAEDHVAIQDMYVVKLLNLDDPEFEFYENVGMVRSEPPCLLQGEYTARCGSLPVSGLGG